MKDNLSIIITIILLVLLIVIFPLYNFFERQDDMSYNLVLKATSTFADQVMNNGYIDQNMYNKFVTELANTGNVYDIQVEAHRKVLLPEGDTDVYTEDSYIDYSSDIFNTIEENTIDSSLMKKTIKNNIYRLNAKDEIYVRVKNSNMTLAGSLFNTIIPASKKDRISVEYGGIIKNNAWKNIDATYKGHMQAPGAPVISFDNENLTNNEEKALPKSEFINKTIKAKSTAFSSEDSGAANSISKYKWKITNLSNNATSTKETTEDTSLEKDTGFFEDGMKYKIEVYAIDALGYRSDTTTIILKIGNPDEQERKFKSEDLDKIQKYIDGTGTLTDSEKETYDINKDGNIDDIDKKYVGEYVQNGYITGDVNQDFKITDDDYGLITRKINNEVTFTEIQQKAADINGDGVISQIDVDYLKEIVDFGYILGDVNNDGKVNINDLVLLQKYIANTLSFSEDEKKRVDMNQDGKVDDDDLTLLQSRVIGM